jgi:hypothetical protein
VGIRPPFFLIKKFNIMKARFGMLMVDAVGKAGGQWREIGSNLNVKNTWGEDKTLQAREAFLKCNGTLYPASGALVNPTNFNYTTPSFEVVSIILSVTSGTLSIESAKDLGSDYFQIKALRLRSKAVNPNVSKLRTASYQIEHDSATDNYAALVSGVGPIKVGDVFSIAVRGISQNGLTSLYSQFQVTAV